MRVENEFVKFNRIRTNQTPIKVRIRNKPNTRNTTRNGRLKTWTTKFTSHLILNWRKNVKSSNNPSTITPFVQNGVLKYSIFEGEKQHKTIRSNTPKGEHKKLGDEEDDKDNNEDMGTISKWRIGREPESARSRSHYRKAPKWHMSHMTNFEWNTFWERSRDVSVLLNIEGLDRTEQSEKFNINQEDQPHPRMNTPN